MTCTIFFSNSRSLERQGLIIETLEYAQVATELSHDMLLEKIQKYVSKPF